MFPSLLPAIYSQIVIEMCISIEHGALLQVDPLG